MWKFVLSYYVTNCGSVEICVWKCEICDISYLHQYPTPTLADKSGIVEIWIDGTFHYCFLSC